MLLPILLPHLQLILLICCMEMEKMRLSMEKEKVRLSEYHKYEDGVVDQPFLTPDSVLEDNV